MINDNQIVERVIKEFGYLRKISHFLIMKNFGLNEELSKIVCQKVWLRQHQEAREMAKGVEI